MFHIRQYNKRDYELVKSWWDDAKEPAPLKGMLPEESTLVLEYEDKPILSLTAYFTNSKEICYLENFVGCPKVDKEIRNKAAHILTEAMYAFVGSFGYNRVVAICYKEPLVKRYEELGMKNTLSNVYTFVKELK